MQSQNKYIEYYFDSKSYNKFQVLQNMEEEVSKEFPNQKAEINLKLNEFGVYVATLVFNNKKHGNVCFVNKDKSRALDDGRKENSNVLSRHRKNNRNKKVSRYEAVIRENKVYGKYRETGNFRPY